MHRTNGGQLRFWLAGSDGWPAGSALSSSPRDSRHAHANAHAQIRLPHHLRTPTRTHGFGLLTICGLQRDRVGAQRTTSRITTDRITYRGGNASAYTTWLQGIDPQTGGKPAYASYIGAKVAQHLDDTGWGVGVVCCITADPHRKSVTRTPAPDAIYPTKSQPFSIICEDNTDSVVDLRSLQ